jgi:outer membrane immunogenic protein
MRITCTVLLMIVVASGAVAEAQQSPVADNKARPELALDYTYARANAPPGGCGCFNLNGGSAEFAWPTRMRGLAIAGDVTVAHAGGIGSSGSSLTLSAFTAGARYSTPMKQSRWQPFGEVLVGYAHAGGSLVQNQTASSNGFAANVGGGLDAYVNRRMALRLVEADYLVTTFANGVNDHQNMLRLSAGVVLRF